MQKGYFDIIPDLCCLYRKPLKSHSLAWKIEPKGSESDVFPTPILPFFPSPCEKSVSNQPRKYY